MSMLNIYEPIDNNWQTSFLRHVPLRHMASELVEEFGYKDAEELQQAMDSAFEVCYLLHIPIDLHFRKVYVYSNNTLGTDWLLSDLGTYLLLINGDVHNPNVAKARIAMVSLMTRH